MNLLLNLVVALQILAALVMIGLVLIQHGKGADMGASFGSGASGSLFGATGSANFLSRSHGGVRRDLLRLHLGAGLHLERSRPAHRRRQQRARHARGRGAGRQRARHRRSADPGCRERARASGAGGFAAGRIGAARTDRVAAPAPCRRSEPSHRRTCRQRCRSGAAEKRMRFALRMRGCPGSHSSCEPGHVSWMPPTW